MRIEHSCVDGYEERKIERTHPWEFVHHGSITLRRDDINKYIDQGSSHQLDVCVSRLRITIASFRTEVA